MITNSRDQERVEIARFSKISLIVLYTRYFIRWGNRYFFFFFNFENSRRGQLAYTRRNHQFRRRDRFIRFEDYGINARKHRRRELRRNSLFELV